MKDIITPVVSWSTYLYRMISFRQLFSLLVWRDMLIRYKQAALGVAWVVVRPVIMMIIFSLLFGRVAGFSHAVPYPLLVLTGLLAWQMFSDSLTFGSGSLIGNANMIQKVYFPRIFIPASSVVCSLIDMGLSLILFVGALLWYQWLPSGKIIYFPLCLVWCFVLTLAVTSFLAALAVRFRDVRFVVPFMIQAGMYISPVGFSSDVIPPAWRLLYFCNPMSGVIHSFRVTLLGEPVYSSGLVISLVITLIISLASFIYFAREEPLFADVI